MGKASNTGVTVGVSSLSALVLVAAFAGALSSRWLSQATQNSEEQRIPSASPMPQSKDSGREVPSEAEIARVLTFLEKHLDSPRSTRQQPREELMDHRNGDDIDGDELPAAVNTATLGESAADALARLEAAYRQSLHESSETAPEEQAILAENLDNATEARVDDGNVQELPAAVYEAQGEVAVLVPDASEEDLSDEPVEIVEEPPATETRVPSLNWVSSVYAPVYIGAAPSRERPPHQPPLTATQIRRGAFFGVHVPINQSSSNQAQVDVSFRAPRTAPRSPWQPIDMSRHNDPWSHSSRSRR